VVRLKAIFKYDDTLDAFGIHGLVGIWGSIATGIFANPNVNPQAIGLLYGNWKQVLVQLQVVGITIVYSAIATSIVYWIISLITSGARVSERAERLGMDEAYHGERGFNLEV
jgi:Amt family ammonium transporter